MNFLWGFWFLFANTEIVSNSLDDYLPFSGAVKVIKASLGSFCFHLLSYQLNMIDTLMHIAQMSSIRFVLPLYCEWMKIQFPCSPDFYRSTLDEVEKCEHLTSPDFLLCHSTPCCEEDDDCLIIDNDLAWNRNYDKININFGLSL